jgi:hypothetical protein
MNRREFIPFIGGAAVAWPLAARAQQGERVRRIGVLIAFAESDPEGQAFVVAFREGLQKLGWTSQPLFEMRPSLNPSLPHRRARLMAAWS